MAGRRDRQSLHPVGLGVEFAAALIGSLLAGAWVDRHYGTAPWGVTTGALIGLVGGLYNFLRASMRAFRASGDEPPGED